METYNWIVQIHNGRKWVTGTYFDTEENAKRGVEYWSRWYKTRIKKLNKPMNRT